MNQIVIGVLTLYQKVSFSTHSFNKYLIQNVTNYPKLLEFYYLVSSQLGNKLALSLESILSCVPNLDFWICELLSVEEEIGEGKINKFISKVYLLDSFKLAYIASMQEDMLKDFFIKDGKQFVDWK